MIIKLILLGLIFSQSLSAQHYGFGRNKIQYTDFNWQVLQTEHFDIYYYPEMEELAGKGAAFAEEGFHDLQTKFNHSIRRRIPLIFYSSHLHFQQTNVTPGFIPEGVGGFFEFMKGRVVIPSDGDLIRFRRVIRHELVHVFMHDKLYNVESMTGQREAIYPPLWFVEGLAEFWSGGWDSQGEMVLRDAVLNNYVPGLQNIESISGSFAMYKIGQDILGYVARAHGEDKIYLMLTDFWRYKTFQENFQAATGQNYEQFDQDYLHDLKKRFYPLMTDHDYNIVKTQTLASDGFNFKPVFYTENDQPYVVYMANVDGYSSIYRKKINTPPDEDEQPELLLKGEAASDFEAFHIFTSKIDVSRNGQIIFSAKSGETDRLYFFDIQTRKLTARKRFPELVGIHSPAWSADDSLVVFSGLSRAGHKDIFIYNPAADQLIQLTNDYYNDLDPVWSPDGRKIVFASDRTSAGLSGGRNLFVMNADGTGLAYLTSGNWQDNSPAFSPDGRWLVFVSDRNLTNNIFVLNMAACDSTERNTLPQTKEVSRYIGSTFDPCWTASGGLIFATYENRRFEIRHDADFLEKSDPVPETRTESVLAMADRWKFETIPSGNILSRKPYLRKYNLDFATSQVSQDPIFGTSGGAQFAFSDVLSDEVYNILVYNNARTSSDLLSSFNFAVTRYSQGRRINLGYGIYRIAGYYYNPQDFYYYEERSGAMAVISYPISEFSRIDFSQILSYSDKEWVFDRRRQAWLNSSTISFIHDNSVWSSSGPIDGQRLNLTFGNTYDFAFSRVNYLVLLADLRRYQRLSLRSAYAVRLLYLMNQGRETRQYYLGGSWDLRLYPRLGFTGQRVFLLSQELRFPLFDAIGFWTPVGSFGFNGISGALFLDAGNAWNNDFGQLYGSFGVGARLRLGYFLVLRLDVGRRTDFRHISGNNYTQFFFGWDF